MYERSYYGGYYPYPPHYSYYPPRFTYLVPKKPLWPLALIAVGILLIAYGITSLPKLDPGVKKYAALYPEKTISVLVFCDPCSGIKGERVGEGKIMVVGKAKEVIELKDYPGVKQIRFLGVID